MEYEEMVDDEEDVDNDVLKKSCSNLELFQSINKIYSADENEILQI